MNRSAVHITGRVVGRGIAALSLWFWMGCGDKLDQDSACSIHSDSTGQTRLRTCDPDSGAMFGSAMALSGDGRTALIGAPDADSAAAPRAAYLIPLN